MKAAFLLCLFLSLSWGASHQASAQERARSETGTMLLERCEGGPANSRWESCRFFVGVAFEFMHVTDRLILAEPEDKVCFTGTFDVDKESLMFGNYLKAHPEKHHMRAIELFYMAMRDAYPCVQTKP